LSSDPERQCERARWAGGTEKGLLRLCGGGVWDHPSSGKNQGKLRINQPQLTPDGLVHLAVVLWAASKCRKELEDGEGEALAHLKGKENATNIAIPF